MTENKKDEMVHFFWDIASENNELKKNLGRVVCDFKLRHAIQEISKMIKNRPTFMIENSTPKVEKVTRDISEWRDWGVPIEIFYTNQLKHSEDLWINILDWAQKPIMKVI